MVIPFNREQRRKQKRELQKDFETLKKVNQQAPSLEMVDFSGMKFPMAVLFRHPVDYPHDIVARIFEMNHPTNTIVMYKSIEDAREDAYKAGFTTVIPRDKRDDPSIVETYVR